METRAFSLARPLPAPDCASNRTTNTTQDLHNPVTWVVWSHFEIPVVALLSRFVLGRGISPLQWVAIVLLLDGVLSSQIAACEAQARTQYASGGGERDRECAASAPLETP